MGKRQEIEKWSTAFVCFLEKNNISVSTRQFHSSSRKSKDDYYKTLGVAKNSTAKDIKKAYFQVGCFFLNYFQKKNGISKIFERKYLQILA